MELGGESAHDAHALAPRDHQAVEERRREPCDLRVGNQHARVDRLAQATDEARPPARRRRRARRRRGPPRAGLLALAHQPAQTVLEPLELEGGRPLDARARRHVTSSVSSQSGQNGFRAVCTTGSQPKSRRYLVNLRVRCTPPPPCGGKR